MKNLKENKKPKKNVKGTRQNQKAPTTKSKKEVRNGKFYFM
jgi:hypothetical protein